MMRRPAEYDDSTRGSHGVAPRSPPQDAADRRAITDSVSGLQVAFDLECAALLTDWLEEEEAA